jgi:hypothetical protein
MWDLRYFAEPNLPSVVARLDRDAFSARGKTPIRVLDMPIKLPNDQMPGHAVMQLTPEVMQFHDAVSQAFFAESALRRIDDLYVYLTVDQKPVPPEGFQRRPGWHSDGFLTGYRGEQLDVVAENAKHMIELAGTPVDHTYVAYDCLGTWFHPGPWALGDKTARERLGECETALRTFAEVVNENPWVVRTYPVYTLLRLDPYDVHAAQRHQGPEPLNRTFVKIAFSVHRYNREGNTRNPLLEYDWPMVPRIPGRREHRFA